MKTLFAILFAGLVALAAGPSQAGWLSAAERAAVRAAELAAEERAAARAAAALERAAAEERAAARAARRDESADNSNFEFKPRGRKPPRRPQPAKCDDDNGDDDDCR